VTQIRRRCYLNLPLKCRKSPYNLLSNGRWRIRLGTRVALATALWVVAIAIGLPREVQAQEAPSPEEDDVEVSYIYAAVMGTGTYQINNRRITMFRLPLAWNQQPASEQSVGWKWLFPLVIGYDDLTDVGSDWFERLLPDQLVTFTALPGIEFVYPVTPNWYIKPFLQIGGGRDFSAEQSFVMTQIGVRSETLFQLSNHWELRWGNSLRWAGEYQFNTEDRTGFGLFETGLDLRRDIPVKLFGASFDVGAFYILQRFLPEWNIGKAPDRRSSSQDLHEFGISMGFKKGRKILGITVQRIRLGYKKGGDLQGWTLGTEFPF
jgi:hypothetical protein